MLSSIRFSRHAGRIALPLALVIMLAACEGTETNFVEPEIAPPDDTVRVNSGLENLLSAEDGSFEVGEAPVLATFSGGELKNVGLARNGDWAWHIAEGTTGEIKFRSPVSELTLWFAHEREPRVTAVPPGGAKASCGVGSQGFDDMEAFGTNVFARGGFNDWGNSGLGDDVKFVNFGGGEYQAEFNIEPAGSYDFKIADGGWAIEYGNPSEDIVIDTPVELSGGAALGGPNSTFIADEAGCFNWKMTIPGGQGVPASAATLEIATVEIFNALLARSQVRVLDEDGEEIALFEGSDLFQPVEMSREAGESRIRSVEIISLLGNPENTSGIGDIIVDDFRMGTAPDTSERTLSIVYTRPDGDYSGTQIEIVTNEGTQTIIADCVPPTDGGFGCIVEFAANGGDIVSYTILNNGVPDDAGTLSFEVNDARDNTITTFSDVDVPILRELPAVPLNENEVILYYKRADDDYEGWGLHLFPEDAEAWTVFEDGEYPFAGIDDDYGAYFIIALPGSDRLTAPYSNSPAAVESFPERLGFVIHRGDEKDPGPDQLIEIASDGNIVFVTSGVLPVSSTPPIPGTVPILGMSAHWVSQDTILWNPGPDVVSVELRHSADAAIRTVGTALIGEDGIFELSSGFNPLTLQPGRATHLINYAAWELPTDAVGEAASLVRDQLVMIGYDADGQRVAATGVQIPLVLDALYAQAAATVPLGMTFENGLPVARVWAPTARTVALNLYSDSTSATPDDTVAMIYDEVTGVWSASGNPGWDRQYYTYAVNVYAPSAAAVVDNEVTDPYSVSLSTGSAQDRLTRSQVVNLADADLAPAGWDGLTKPALAAPEDIALYELHIRDFSVLDATVPAADRGKYTAFAGNGAGVQHLTALADAGLTHVHVLPSFDIATVNEDSAQRVEITDSVDALCAANPAAASLCEDFSGMTIEQVMAAEAGDSNLQQQIAEWLKDLDGFNWGYDPFHYSVPEGSYASDPEGPTRITEFRTMVKGLSDIGLRTVMDVVYNHTNAAGNISDRSVLDRIVPGYYHRQNEFNGAVLQDSCCPDTASEHAMMEKLIVDSTVLWAREYKVDGFRFDLMGFHSRSTMERVRDALRLLNMADDGVDGASIYVYGEGWNFGDVQDDRRFVQATQANLGGTGIGSFSDRLRDSVRGGGPFDVGAAHVATQGFASGLFYDPNAANGDGAADLPELLAASDLIRLGMAANLQAYEFEDATGATVRGDMLDYEGQVAGYTDDPQEIINFVASHDGETLWDISAYKHPTDTTATERLRAHNVAQSIVLLGQGIPFMHAGQDMLRSKSMDRNSFDSGDWFNRLDFSYADNNFAVGVPRNSENMSSLTQIREVLANPLAKPGNNEIVAATEHAREMLEVRRSSRLFRLRTANQVIDRVSYHNTGPGQVPGLIVQSITDGAKCTGGDLDPALSKVVTVVNPTLSDQTFALFTDEDFDLHPVLAASADTVVQGASHSAAGFAVPARTTAVFVQTEDAVDCGPLGADVYVRGSMNDFGVDDNARFDLRGSDQSEVLLELDPDLYFFKIADDSESFAVANCGAGDSSVQVELNTPFEMLCSPSSRIMQLAIPGELRDEYRFSLDVSDAERPLLTVSPSDLDLEPPVVAITTPLANAVLSVNTAITATATDDIGVTEVRFFADGEPIGSTMTADGDDFSITWDIDDTDNGVRVLTAVAEDASGKMTTSEDVTVTVDTSLANDTIPPTVALDPVPAMLGGTVTLSAVASDLPSSDGLQVRFFYAPDDGSGMMTLIGNDSIGDPDFSIDWDTTEVANGSYLVFAEAVDGADNATVTPGQPTVVQNSGTFGTDIFVCGILDACSNPPAAGAQLGFLGSDQFGGTLNLAGGVEYAFRIVDSDGATVGALLDCGSESLFTPVIPGQPFTLDCQATANDATLDLSQEVGSDDYTFMLDASNQFAPVLTVTPVGEPLVGGPNDMTPPTVTVTELMQIVEPPPEPSECLDTMGSVICRQQMISVSAVDSESDIERVEFWLLTAPSTNPDPECGDDGVVCDLLWVDTTEPYSAPWDTEAVANGDHHLFAIAVDASTAANQNQSALFPVTVSNIGPYDVSMYPRGSWDPNFDLLPGQLPMTYLGRGMYTDTLTLADGTFRYKIAAEDFDVANANCNPPVDNTPAILTVPLQFVCSAQSGNAKFDLSLEPADTEYTFMLDASRSIAEPLATVSRADEGPAPMQGDMTPPVFTTALTLDPATVPVAGDIIINASVTDDNAVASVTFLVDNEVIWADFTPPFQAPWDSTLSEDGLRTITALAEDANGNIGGSAPLQVEVDNPEFGPFGVPMFVRGAFVDDPDLQFGITHPIVLLQEGGSVYEATINVDTSGFFVAFKVADAGWTEGTNCGVGAATTPGLGVETEMICSAADNGDNPTVNINLNLLGQPQPADYKFTIDATGFPATRPKVTVTAGD
ncbi:MAG: pullulanase-type alpha-1,6-glucosidase [Pseudomonadota bacterium]